MAPDSYWKDSGEWPPWRKQLKGIDDPIAEDSFTYRNSDGKRVKARVVIGHPKPVPKGFGTEWYCPLIIEGWHLSGVSPVMGMGPVTALVNAGSVVRAFLEETVLKVPARGSSPTSKRQPPRKQPAKASAKKSARPSKQARRRRTGV